MFDAASYSFVPQLKATDVRAPADVLSAGLSPAVVHHPIIKICVAKRYTGGLYRYRTKGGLIVLAYITIKLFPFPAVNERHKKTGTENIDPPKPSCRPRTATTLHQTHKHHTPPHPYLTLLPSPRSVYLPCRHQRARLRPRPRPRGLAPWPPSCSASSCCRRQTRS